MRAWMNVSGELRPSLFYVSLGLCLSSITMGLILIGIEYLIGHELPSMGFFTTIFPALLVGIFFGNRSGEFMPANIRWCAILIWTLFNLLLMVALFAAYGISLVAFFHQLGWFNLMIVAVLALSIPITYFVIRSGEKTGIKAYLKRSNA